MYYLDSHIHLQDYKTQEVKNVVNNAAKNNILRFINASSHPNDWQSIKKLAEIYPQIIPAFGVHPWHIYDIDANWNHSLEHYIRENQYAIIGECGIDNIKNQDTETQIKILLPQIELANKYSRPLILHSVKANQQFINLFSLLPQRTVFHSFTGSGEWGREIQKHGFFIGLNFSILRKNRNADILRSINLEKILLETDGPYQNNNPHDGETLPQNLPLLAEKVAELIGIQINEFLEILSYNQQEFLGELNANNTKIITSARCYFGTS